MKSENSAIYRLRATLEQLKNWIDRPLNNNVLVLVLDTMAKMIKQVSFYSPESRSSLHNDYSALFKEVLVPLYTKANDFSTKSELKVHSLRLMACILTSAPRDFFDSNFDSWLNKRVLAHVYFFCFIFYKLSAWRRQKSETLLGIIIINTSRFI